MTGALPLLEARPELFVVALNVVPFRTKLTRRPLIAVPPVVLSVAERVIEAFGLDAVVPVYARTVVTRGGFVTEIANAAVAVRPAPSVARTVNEVGPAADG